MCLLLPSNVEESKKIIFYCLFSTNKIPFFCEAASTPTYYICDLLLTVGPTYLPTCCVTAVLICELPLDSIGSFQHVNTVSSVLCLLGYLLLKEVLDFGSLIWVFFLCSSFWGVVLFFFRWVVVLAIMSSPPLQDQTKILATAALRLPVYCIFQDK